MDKRIFLNQRGLSLAEVLLVILLIGFIVPVIYNIPNSIRLVGSSNKTSLAKEIASKAVEDARILTYDNLALGQSTINDPRISKLPSGAGSLNVTTCSAPVCTNNEETKNISVTINWDENGAPKSFKLTTLVSSGGLR